MGRDITSQKQVEEANRKLAHVSRPSVLPEPHHIGRAESWADLRSPVLKVASVPIMGIADRAEHNRRGMTVTLAALARAAENVEPQA